MTAPRDNIEALTFPHKVAVTENHTCPVALSRDVEHNYEAANEFFSFQVLETELRLIVERPQNIYRLLGRGRRGRKSRFENARNPNVHD